MLMRHRLGRLEPLSSFGSSGGLDAQAVPILRGTHRSFGIYLQEFKIGRSMTSAKLLPCFVSLLSVDTRTSIVENARTHGDGSNNAAKCRDGLRAPWPLLRITEDLIVPL